MLADAQTARLSWWRGRMMQNRDIFYGRDIPKLFPKPEFWPEMSEIEPDEIYTIEHYNYNNRHISFQRCRWLKPSEGGGRDGSKTT